MKTPYVDLAAILMLLILVLLGSSYFLEYQQAEKSQAKTYCVGHSTCSKEGNGILQDTKFSFEKSVKETRE